MRSLLLTAILAAGCNAAPIEPVAPGCHWRLTQPASTGDQATTGLRVLGQPHLFAPTAVCAGPDADFHGFWIQAQGLGLLAYSPVVFGDAPTNDTFAFQSDPTQPNCAAWSGSVEVSSDDPVSWQMHLRADCAQPTLHVEGTVYGNTAQ